MGTVIQEKKKNGSKRFRAEVRREGKRMTKRFSRKTDAKQWITELEAKLVRGEKIPTLKRYTVADAIKRYCKEVLPLKRAGTIILHRTQLAWWSNRIGYKKLSSLSPSDISEAREQLITESFYKGPTKEAQTRKPATANRYLQIFNHVMSVAQKDWQWIEHQPKISKLREPPAKGRYLAPQEAARILDALLNNKKPEMRLIARISATLGSRLGETCALRWIDIDFARSEINFVINTKTGKHKTLPLPPGLYDELWQWKEKSFHSEYLFPTSRRGKKPYVYDSVKKEFYRTVKKLGLIGIGFHTFRHTVASWATQKGFKTFQVQQTLGHAHVSTTNRYAHLDTVHLRPVVETIESMLEMENMKLKEENLH